MARKSVFASTRGRIVASVGGIAVAISASACGGSAASASSSSTIKLGVESALTGPFSAYGQAYALGAKLAVADINNRGGINVKGHRYKIQIVLKDTRSTVDTAVTDTTGLVRDDHVKFLMGPTTSIEAIPVQQLTQKQNVLEITDATGLGATGVLTPTTAAAGGAKALLFQSQASDTVREGIFAKWTADRASVPAGSKQIILASDDANGKAIGAQLQKQLIAQGYQVPDPVLFPTGTTDFSPYLTRIKGQHPAVLHLLWIPTDTVRALQQAFQLQVTNKYFAVFTEPQQLPKAPAGVTVLSSCNPLCSDITTSPGVGDFFTKAKAANGGTLPQPPGLSVLMYESIEMLARAMESAGTVTDPKAVAQALAGLNYQGQLLGSLSYDSSHILQHGYDVCVTEQGKSTCQNMKAG